MTSEVKIKQKFRSEIRMHNKHYSSKVLREEIATLLMWSRIKKNI
jgi:hypothetical protein